MHQAGEPSVLRLAIMRTLLMPAARASVFNGAALSNKCKVRCRLHSSLHLGFS